MKPPICSANKLILLLLQAKETSAIVLSIPNFVTLQVYLQLYTFSQWFKYIDNYNPVISEHALILQKSHGKYNGPMSNSDSE